MGYTIPEDISVIGFDGISLGEFYLPRLTTIKQLSNSLADEGLSILLDCIENNAEPVNKYIPFEFVHGESVKRVYI